MAVQARWSPTEYRTNNRVQLGHATEILDVLNWNHYSSILDVGCGDGKITHHISDVAPHASIVGLDSDKEMYIFAREHYKMTSNLSFQHASIECAVLKQSFDLVVSFSALHWVKEQTKALANIASSLQSQGELHAVLYPRCSYHDAALIKVMARQKWKPFFANFQESFFNYDVEYYTNLLSELPFSHFEATRKELEPVRFPGISDLTHFMGAWLPQSRHLPEEYAQDFLSELCLEYASNLNQDPSGELQIPFALIILKAIKH